MRVLLALFVVSAILTGCSTNSTTVPSQSKPHPSGEDFSKLSNDQLCEMSFTRKDPQIEEELYVRYISCDRVDLACRKQGFQRNTLAMVDCVYNEKLKNQSPNVKACFESGVSKNDINGMTNCLIEKERLHNIERHDIINFDYEIDRNQ